MTEVISLINEKGGVGKSTSAITIAQILAISEYKVLLIDLDPQMNTTKMYGQAEANPDIDYERLFCEKQKNKNEYNAKRAFCTHMQSHAAIIP